MVVGDVDHPGPDEGILVEHLGLQPSAGSGESRSDRPGLPRRAVKQAPDLPPQGAIADHILLAKEERQLGRELASALYEEPQGIREIVKVQEGLSALEVARIETALEAALVDARDLVREERVIDAGGPEDGDRDPAVLSPE